MKWALRGMVKWWNTQLLPNIPVHSAIALDNTSYHKVTEKVPTKPSTKVMKEWLDEHNIPYQCTDLKKDLLQLIQQQNSKPIYLTGVAAAETGHDALRLLIANCELNPLSSHGQSSKDLRPQSTTKFFLTEVQRLTPEAFESVTTKMSTNFVKLVINTDK